MKRLFATTSLACMILKLSLGCTAFCICSDSGNFLAKNLDWPVDAGLILVNRSGVQKSSFPVNGLTVSWTSRYSSLTFNQFGMEFPLGGMNEQGLVVEELNMPSMGGVQGQPSAALNEFQIVQYILDNFSTVGETERGMMHFHMVPLLISLHYLVMDKSGGSMVMEFDGIRFQFHHSRDTGIPVLSNNLYRESLRYLGNFRGFGGNLEVVRRPGSNERFVTVASMLYTEPAEAPVTRSIRILKAVSQPDTRWSIVYDATHLIIYFKFHGCPDWKMLSLDRLFDLEAGYTLGADVSDCRENPSAFFHPVSPEENRALISGVFQQLTRDTGLEAGEEVSDQLACYGSHYILH